jgi:deoxyribonuclease-4
MVLINSCNCGSHVSYDRNIVNTLETSALKGQTFCQFFLGNPKSYRRQKLSEVDIYNIRESTVLQRFPMRWCTHAPYMMSLTGYGGKLAWKNDSAATSVIENKVIPNLLQELEDVHNAGGLGVVVHPGSYGKKLGNTGDFSSSRDGLLTVAETLNRADIQYGKVLLENCAGEGSKLPRTLEDIRIIFDNLSQQTLEHVGVCIDTAHLQGVGEHDLSNNIGVDTLFSRIDSLNIPVELIHLNDSKIPFGGRRDLHQTPGFGEIWNNSTDTLKYFVSKCKSRNIPFIVECCEDSIDWEIILN